MIADLPAVELHVFLDRLVAAGLPHDRLCDALWLAVPSAEAALRERGWRHPNERDDVHDLVTVSEPRIGQPVRLTFDLRQPARGPRVPEPLTLAIAWASQQVARQAPTVPVNPHAPILVGGAEPNPWAQGVRLGEGATITVTDAGQASTFDASGARVELDASGELPRLTRVTLDDAPVDTGNAPSPRVVLRRIACPSCEWYGQVHVSAHEPTRCPSCGQPAEVAP